MKYIYTLFMSLLFLGCGGSGGSALVEDDTLTEPNDTMMVAEPTTQEKTPMLVIRLQYNNQTFVNNAFTWSNKVFSSASGQMNDYYNEVSYGKFSYERAVENEGNENDGVITVSLNRNHPNVSIDVTPYTIFKNKVHPDLAEGINKADAYIDFSAYDDNNDSVITSDELTIIFIFAGQEDAYAGHHISNGIWAHMDSTDSATLADGVSLLKAPSNYALFGERHDNHDATIGIIAHELGHATFGLPDLYDTSTLKGFGIGSFGYMGGGSWGYTNNDALAGSSPVHPTAWTKVQNGWITPTTGSGNQTFYESASSAYNIHKRTISGSGNSEKYYLYENRNNSGYDKGLYLLDGVFSGGLAIWEIDESIIASGSASNSVNTGTNQGVKLIQANRLQTSASQPGHEKNLFYNGNVNSYTSGTRDVTDISTRGSSMTATIQ